MVLQNCCGCCSLKTGVLIIAILTLITATLSMLTMIVQLAMPRQNVPDPNEIFEIDDKQQSSNVYAYMIGPSIVQFVIALCFIYGVAKEKKYFILPTLIVNMIGIVVLSIFIISLAVTVHSAFLLLFVLIALSFYLWYAIFSFYKNLSERDALPAAPYSTIEMDKNNLVEKM